MDKERSRRDGTANVTFERILPGGQNIDGNVQNIAYPHLLPNLVEAARGPLSRRIH